jgi:mono/diheme cytochrome c family protein
MPSRALLAGVTLAAVIALTGCTGRQILAMRERHAKPAAPGVSGPAAPATFTGPALAATTDYPKNPNAPRPEPPAEFASLKDPLQPTPDNLAKGKEIYTANCAPCHGVSGAGDGPAAPSLNPKPADFQTPIHAKLPDGYWFWRLTKGGGVSPFKEAGSAMPPWEGTLSVQQRWLVILYEHTFAEHK